MVAINKNIDGEAMAFLLVMQTYVISAIGSKVVSVPFGLRLLAYLNEAAQDMIGTEMVDRLGAIVTHPSEAADLRSKLDEMKERENVSQESSGSTA